jgi:hypothetical protein
MQPGRVAASTAADMQGFGYGEHLLVWAWRRIATGQSPCPVMAQAFRHACGEDGPEVFLTLCTFLKALGFASRRHLMMGKPGCPEITADERQVLTLIAAAQAATPALFEAHLRWMTRPPQRHVLKIAAGALGTALKVNQLCLALPDADAPAACLHPLALAGQARLSEA